MLLQPVGPGFTECQPYVVDDSGLLYISHHKSLIGLDISAAIEIAVDV